MVRLGFGSSGRGWEEGSGMGVNVDVYMNIYIFEEERGFSVGVFGFGSGEWC